MLIKITSKHSGLFKKLHQNPLLFLSLKQLLKTSVQSKISAIVSLTSNIVQVFYLVQSSKNNSNFGTPLFFQASVASCKSLVDLRGLGLPSSCFASNTKSVGFLCSSNSLISCSLT